MTTHIDFRTLPANVPVLCIPRVYTNISEARIRKIFDDLNMGSLDRIDIVSKNSVKPGANHLEKGDKFNRVFVHFRRWNDTENANIARERLLNGKEIKIIYDDPWFWKISAYRETERKPMPPQNGGHRKATLQFDSDEDGVKTEPSSKPRRQYDRPRPDFSREKPFERRKPEERRQDTRREKPFEGRKPDDEFKKKEKNPVEKENNIVEEDGDISIPFKKRSFVPIVITAKKVLKIEDEKESGKLEDEEIKS